MTEDEAVQMLDKMKNREGAQAILDLIASRRQQHLGELRWFSQALDEANARVAGLEHERDALNAELVGTRERLADAEREVAALTARVGTSQLIETTRRVVQAGRAMRRSM